MDFSARDVVPFTQGRAKLFELMPAIDFGTLAHFRLTLPGMGRRRPDRRDKQGHGLSPS